MANPLIKIRRSATPNKVPSTTQLQLGELAINTYDGKLYLEQDQGGAGVGNTVIAVNPWTVGVGTTGYNTYFNSGKVGINSAIPAYNLDIGGHVNFTGNLYQGGNLFTSGVGINSAGSVIGTGVTILNFIGVGNTFKYNATTNTVDVSIAGGGGASVTTSDTAPSSPDDGDMWFNSQVGELYVYYDDGNSEQWVEAAGGSETVTTSDTAPPSPNDGDLWWNSLVGELKVYYNDGSSSQWVDANAAASIQRWDTNTTAASVGVTTTSFVGIGTTTAKDALTVVGSANISGVTTFGSHVNVGGNLTVTGTTTFNGGTLTLGDANTDNIVFGGEVDSHIIPDDDNTFDIGSASKEWRNLYVDGTANIDALIADSAKVSDLTSGRVVLAGTAGELEDSSGLTFSGGTLTATTFVGALTGNASGNAATATALQNARTIGGVSFDGTANINLPGVNQAGNQNTSGTAAGLSGTPNITVADIIAASLDISGNADIDGTLEADAYTVNGTALNEYIADTVGAMVSSNTETNITVTYEDSDNTLDFVIGTLNQNTTGNAATATALQNARTIGGVSFDGTANINLPGVNQAGNQNTSGTAAGLSGSPSIAVNSVTGVAATFTGNLTVGGVLTYEDVTNIDSVGIITARAGIIAQDDVTFTGNSANAVWDKSSNTFHLADNAVLEFGGGQDLKIRHNGANSFIEESGTGALYVDSNHIIFRKYNTGEVLSQFSADGAVQLYFDNSKKFETTSAGGTLTGTLTATAFSGPLTGNVTGNASGSSGSCTGNAATATALQNARTIGGVSFDGTANINLPGVNQAGNQNTSGNAATATALQNARTIGGVSFDGTANINLPGVNQAGNQNTSGNASTASVATEFTTTANNTTNETVYPVFVDGATGSQGAETDTGLTYNPSTGNLSATKFTGDGSALTGVISGVGIHSSGTVIGTGVTTLNFIGVGNTFSYNASTDTVDVSIAGGGGASVTVQDAPPSSPSAGDLWWESDTGELKIYYNDGNTSQWVDANGSEDSVFISTTAPSSPQAGDLWFNNESGDLLIYYTDTNTSQWVSVNAANSGSTHWHSNSTGISTTQYVGIGTTTATDALTVLGATDLDGTLLVSGFTTFTGRVTLDNGTNAGKDIQWQPASDRLAFFNNTKATFGDGVDLQIVADGSNSKITHNGDGNLWIEAAGSGEDIYLQAADDVYIRTQGGENAVRCLGDGAVELYYDNSKKFQTESTGVKSFGHIVPSANDTHHLGIDSLRWNTIFVSNDIDIKDNGKILLGDGDDLQLFHDASHSYILNGTGDLILKNSAANYLRCAVGDGSVDLYHNSNVKFSTTSAGAKVTGNLEVTGVLTYEDVTNIDSVGIVTARDDIRIITDNKKLKIGAGGDLELYHNGSHNIIRSVNGNLYLQDADYIEIGDPSGKVSIGCVPGGATNLRYNGNTKLATTNTGVSVTGAITASQGGTITGNTQFNGAVDIGDDNGSNYHRVRLGASQDLSLWHDGSNSYISNTTGDLFVQTAASKAVYIRPNNGVNGIICHPAGAVDLYHDATKKFSTTSSGAALDSLGATTTLEIISDTESSIDFNDHGGSAKRYKVGTNISDNSSQFEIKDMTANAERLRITSAGDVGIGYNSPTVKLHVREGASGASSYDNRYHMICENNGEAYLGFYVPSNSYAGIRFNDNTGLEGYIDYYFNTDEMAYSSTAIHRWTTAGSERLRIDSTGKVLIGDGATYSANGLLHIVGDDNSNGPELYLQVNNNNTTDNIGALWFGNNVDKSLVKLAGHTHTANNTADFTVSTSAAGTLGERLRITSTGLVQIGPTHNASTYGWDARLKVAVEQSGNDPSAIHFGESANGSANPSLNFIRRDGSTLWSAYAGQIYYDTEKFVFATSANAAPGSHSFGTRMIIKHTGDVSIGQPDSSSGATLHLRSSSSAHTKIELSTKDNYNGSHQDAYISFVQQNGTELALIHCDTNTGAANRADLAFYTNFGGVYERMRITESGNITVSTNDVKLSGSGTLRINSGSTSGTLNLDGGATNHGGEISLYGGSNGGRILFRTGQGSGQQGEKMRLDENGNLGVNYTSTQSWGAKLRVGGLLLSDQGSGNPYAFGKLSSAQDFVIGRTDTSGNITEHFRILSSGESRFRFTSNNSTVAEGLFINNQQNTTGNNASIIFSNDSGNRKKASISYVDTGSYGTGDMTFCLDNDADSGELHLTNHERMRITKDGQLRVTGDGNQNPGDNIEVNRTTLADSNGNPIISGTPWYTTSCFDYNTNKSPAMDYYWIKIVEGMSSTALGYIEYVAIGDSNYPRSVRGTIEVMKYANSSLSICHDQYTAEKSVVQLVVDSNQDIWMRFHGYDWNHDMRFRLVYGEGVTMNSDFTVGTNSTSVGRMRNSDASPPNASIDIVPGSNIRWSLSNSNPPNSFYSNDVHKFRRVYISNNLQVVGSLSKGSGSFKIPHPLTSLKDTKDLVHSFIEGPQCDNIYRGKVDLVGGTATVNIDTKSGMTAGTFVALNRDVQCFTTNETGWTAVKGIVSGNTLTITAQDNSCTDTVSWMVVGERQDDVIKSSDLTDNDGNLIIEPARIIENLEGTDDVVVPDEFK